MLSLERSALASAAAPRSVTPVAERRSEVSRVRARPTQGGAVTITQVPRTHTWQEQTYKPQTNTYTNITVKGATTDLQLKSPSQGGAVKTCMWPLIYIYYTHICVCRVKPPWSRRGGTTSAVNGLSLNKEGVSGRAYVHLYIHNIHMCVCRDESLRRRGRRNDVSRERARPEQGGAGNTKQISCTHTWRKQTHNPHANTHTNTHTNKTADGETIAYQSKTPSQGGAVKTCMWPLIYIYTIHIYVCVGIDHSGAGEEE